MKASDILRKLTSRKLWAAAVGVASGLSIVFGLEGEVITTVAGAVVSTVSVVSYIVTEGRIDAAAVKDAIEDIQQAGDVIAASPDTLSNAKALPGGDK